MKNILKQKSMNGMQNHTKDELENELGILEQEIAAYEEGLRKYWFDSDLQIQIRENIKIRKNRLNQLEALMCN